MTNPVLLIALLSAAVLILIPIWSFRKHPEEVTAFDKLFYLGWVGLMIYSIYSFFFG